MSSRPFTVGIIGGIGSGKSAVTSILRGLGAYVIVADEINAELLCDADYIAKINALFPEAVQDGAVNTALLSAVIYNDETKRRQLMGLSHPIIINTMRERTVAPLTFYEIPLYNGNDIKLDLLWYVLADAAIRIERVNRRSGMAKETVRRIIELQGNINTDGQRTVTIDNNGDYSALKAKVEELYCELLQELQQ